MSANEFTRDVIEMIEAQWDEQRRAEGIVPVLSEVEPTCDICGFSEENGLTGLWNGETGNHRECETSFGVWEPADCDYT